MSEPNETRQTPPDGAEVRPASEPQPGQPQSAEKQPSSMAGANTVPVSSQPAGGADRPAAPPRGGESSMPAALARGSVPTIHYQLSYVAQNLERGPRGAIVLLHDLPGGAFVWRRVMPALAATGRAVYAFDMLGYGASDHPWPSDTTVWGHADNLAPALRALGLDDVILVGIGVGGGVAQVLATRLYRASIGGLALINTYAYGYAYAADWPMTKMEQRHDPDAPRHVTNDQLLAELRATLPNGAVDARALSGSALEAYLSEWNSALGREMFFQHIRNMLPDYLNAVASDLRHLTMPTLLVWGEQDHVTPAPLGQRLARDIPGADLAVVANAGHMILDEAPDRVGALLVEFAAKVKRQATAGVASARSA